MRKYLVLALIPMFFAAMGCQKKTEAPTSMASPGAVASPAEAPSAEAPAAGGEEASPAAPGAEASPAASPAAP